MHRAGALLNSTHPGPSLAVSAIVVLLGFAAGLEPWRAVLLGCAVLAGQASVGLSNDWLDAGRDRAVGRTDKPVAMGRVSERAVAVASGVTGVLGLALTIPLGWAALAAHAGFIACGWAYNAGLKSTPVSVLPYLLGFGILPLVVTLALAPPALPAWWAPAAGALLGVAAHFANALPDLADDAATGVRGLPHRLGARASGLVTAGAFAAASGVVVFGPGDALEPWRLVLLGAALAIAVGCVALVLRGRFTRALFRLVILGSLVTVALLLSSAGRLLA
jgi:4-hydroxybenzoate polyprenyltransferase